jgi:hypothetical protein
MDMKIVITYEKQDLLKLVRVDLEARGIRPKESSLAYRGALRVRFEVEVDEEGASVVEVAPASKPARTAEPPAAPATEGAPLDMDAILGASQALERSRPGLFQGRPGAVRELGPNEFYEYPKEA